MIDRDVMVIVMVVTHIDVASIASSYKQMKRGREGKKGGKYGGIDCYFIYLIVITIGMFPMRRSTSSTSGWRPEGKKKGRSIVNCKEHHPLPTHLHFAHICIFYALGEGTGGIREP
jgi:hypothetical protein